MPIPPNTNSLRAEILSGNLNAGFITLTYTITTLSHSHTHLYFLESIFLPISKMLQHLFLLTINGVFFRTPHFLSKVLFPTV